ncbi:MAG: penicillin-binding protein, partial [Enterobacter kobei]|nr:penicillin-binding protein [Enterobacter kobei]
LNRAPFGGTLQGVGAASWAYLGKPPSQLSYAEAALLAVLPQAPSRLRPDRWPERAQAARDKVLARMAQQGVWSAHQVQESREEPVWLSPRQMPQLAPLFARLVAGKTRSDKIVTTLDAGLQRQLEDLALNVKTRLPQRSSLAKTRLPQRSSLAMIVVDHTDMKVRGWVGSVDINDDSRFSHVDMVTAVRSPGSVLKPFIYGLAMDDGLIHPASLLQDVPRLSGDYRPGNFDSGFHGPVSMSEALVRSLNLPAVQVLEAYGPKRFAGRLRNAGLPLPLAWKTGTSYGYRDAWAIGINARYVIGIWVGRPDGTPVAGQFGFASAVPLLNQVHNLLQAQSVSGKARQPVDPRPASVTRGVICWPGGQALPQGDSNCRRRLATWLLDGSEPPTLLLPDQESVNGIRFPIWLNKAGERVAADCPDATQQTLIVWPRPLEAWLPSGERRAARLPPASAQCPPPAQTAAAPLLLTGVREGALIRRLPGEAQVSLPLYAPGGEGRRWWFINGKALTESSARLTLQLAKAGNYQVVVMDTSGQMTTVSFELR